MNLVVGATGLLGGKICRLLAAQGKPLRAMVTDIKVSRLNVNLALPRFWWSKLLSFNLQLLPEQGQRYAPYRTRALPNQ